MRAIICRISYIVKYMDNLPTFGKYQGFTDDKIIDLVKFSLPCKLQKKLLIQGFNFSTKSFNVIVDLFKRLDMAKDIFHEKGDGT